MDHAHPEQLFERIEISVTVQERVSEKQTKRGDPTVDGFTDSNSISPQGTIVFSSSNCQFGASGWENLQSH
jgi:hypothetical protein